MTINDIEKQIDLLLDAKKYHLFKFENKSGEEGDKESYIFIDKQICNTIKVLREIKIFLEKKTNTIEIERILEINN